MSERKLFILNNLMAIITEGILNLVKDNYLYLGFGDGGSSGDPQNNAQDLSNFWEKF